MSRLVWEWGRQLSSTIWEEGEAGLSYRQEPKGLSSTTRGHLAWCIQLPTAADSLEFCLSTGTIRQIEESMQTWTTLSLSATEGHYLHTVSVKPIALLWAQLKKPGMRYVVFFLFYMFREHFTQQTINYYMYKSEKHSNCHIDHHRLNFVS